jgi:ABC-type nitrate/sulfonate/bicarbonate transport system substrate-binding protein
VVRSFLRVLIIVGVLGGGILAVRWLIPRETPEDVAEQVARTTPPEVENKFVRKNGTISIGYFHGGRTMLLYRTLHFKEFEREAVNIELITKYLNGTDYFPMFLVNATKKPIKTLGKVTGDELAEKLGAGEFDGATLGETAYLKAVASGMPIVAVAELGHDVKDKAGHALMLHNDVKIKGPESFKGLTFGARRSSGGDVIVIKEFIRKQGLDPDRDVKIIENINDEVFWSMLGNHEIDGCYGHGMGVRKSISKLHLPVYIYRPLDWVNPEISHSVLVFSKAFLDSHRPEVKKIVRAYMRRIKIESEMSEEERKKPAEKGLEISFEFEGLSLPEYRKIPLVQENLLTEWKQILLRNKVISKDINLPDYIDNSFVREVSGEIYGDPNPKAL